MYAILENVILENMRMKSTDELLNIWIYQDHREWSEEAFSAIRQILIERGVAVPDPIFSENSSIPEQAGAIVAGRERSQQGDGECPVVTGEDIRADIRGWGIGFLVVGAIHILVSGFLNPLWGGILMLLGLVNLLIQHRVMYIVNGAGILLAGIMNIVLTGGNPGWLVFGILQLKWGVGEIQKYGQAAHVL